ncbi:hypothetical protein [Mycolicibacterium stellerae]|uniref:hypothetical protein n=1 Tax=Mycolicibacterium stellerae TaxID=2358193 RepID=UPI0013DDDDBC|nr:hypothetical protein [Mycolicibacterium stellerae]
MSEHDSAGTPGEGSPCRALRVALALNSSGHHPAATTETVAERWIELGASRAAIGPVVRVSATDLRDAARRARALRADAARQAIAAPVIFLEVGVLIDPEPRRALRALARLDRETDQTASLRYVGSPRGLAGFAADIHALDIADGIAVLPLTMPGSATHVIDGLLEALAEMGFESAPEAVGAARRFLVGAVA